MVNGHLRQRKNKDGTTSWQIILEEEASGGKRNRSYHTVRGTKKQAEIIKRKLIADMEAGNILAPSTKKLEDWMWEWLQLYKPNIETSTRIGYTEKIKKYIVPELGHIPLKSLQASNVQSWVNKLSKEHGLAPKTIRNAYQNLDAAMKQAVLLKMIPHNPCVGVVLPKAKAYKAEVYDQQEITKLFTAAKGTEMYLPILLEISVGLRRGELIALRWDHVDLDAGIIHVREASVNGESKTETKAPKSSAGVRDVAIGQNVVTELRAARAEYNRNKLAMGAAFTDSGLVVCQQDGKPYRPDSMSQKWRRFVAQNGLKPIRFHDLRHTCATAMVANGVDAATVKERLGHADVSTTLKYYTHRTKSMDQSAAKKLDDMIFSDVI